MAQAMTVLTGQWADLNGTSCDLPWRSVGGRELVCTVNPGRPITGGLPPVFAINSSKMYGEYFDISQDGELIFAPSLFEGEVFRSGCCFQRGAGRILCSGPGDQEYPIYHQPIVRRVATNGVCRTFREQGAQPEPCRLQKMESGWIDTFAANPSVPRDSSASTAPRAVKLGGRGLLGDAQASRRDVLAFCAREGRDPKAADTGN